MTALGFNPTKRSVAILHDTFEQLKTVGTLPCSLAFLNDYITLIQIKKTGTTTKSRFIGIAKIVIVVMRNGNVSLGL